MRCRLIVHQSPSYPSFSIKLWPSRSPVSRYCDFSYFADSNVPIRSRVSRRLQLGEPWLHST